MSTNTEKGSQGSQNKMYDSVTRFCRHFHSLVSLQVGRAYLFLFGKFLVPFSLSFLLSFSFLEKRFGDEDLVLGWDSAVMLVKVYGQLGEASTFRWRSTFLVVVGGRRWSRLKIVIAVTNPQNGRKNLITLNTLYRLTSHGLTTHVQRIAKVWATLELTLHFRLQTLNFSTRVESIH
jgi:hypothetical protein